MPALSKLCARQFFYHFLAKEDLSMNIVRTFIKDIETNPITRIRTFLHQVKFISMHYHIYDVPPWIWDRLHDLVSVEIKVHQHTSGR